jgi:hypothetical protein
MRRARAVPMTALACMLGITACADSHHVSWTDLFEVRDPVSLSDTTVSALTTWSPDEENSRGPSGIARVSVSALRSGRPGSMTATRGGSSGFAVLTASAGALGRSVAPPPLHVLDTPYWPSVFHRIGATNGDRIFVATNLVYPILVYDNAGELIDSVGRPPPSWRQARRPALGEFPPNRKEEWRDYLGSFTVISALAVLSDSVLVVTHGRLSAEEDPPYRVVGGTTDVYLGKRRIAVDLPVPGELVAYSKTSLFFLTRPDGQRQGNLVEYVWRDW